MELTSEAAVRGQGKGVKTRELRSVISELFQLNSNGIGKDSEEPKRRNESKRRNTYLA